MKNVYVVILSSSEDIRPILITKSLEKAEETADLYENEEKNIFTYVRYYSGKE